MLGAGGLIAEAWEDVKKVRYPKTVRALAELEERAVEIGAYVCTSIHGLLQTPEHARALFRAAQPPYASDDVERMVAARMARQSVFERDPAPAISFVLEEATLLREVGGTMVWVDLPTGLVRLFLEPTRLRLDRRHAAPLPRNRP